MSVYVMRVLWGRFEGDLKTLASLSLVRQTPTSIPSVHLKQRLPPVTQSKL